MAYNLGADPKYDTPKKQMQYLADHVFDIHDANVYGGWFQWGRGYEADRNKPDKDKIGWRHAVQINTLPDGTVTRTRRWGPGIANGVETYANVGYDANGQPNSPNGTMFIAGAILQNDALWGNGKTSGVETSGSGVVCSGCTDTNNDGKFFQSTTWVMPQNNPCPSGFRVPTEDEWERLGAYDCLPNYVVATVNITGIPDNGKSNGKGLTWVPVVCATSSAVTGKCVASNSWDIPRDNSGVSYDANSAGYAIYADADWTANTSYTTDLTNPAAKEPLLFLPRGFNRHHNSSDAQKTSDAEGDYWMSTVSATSTLARSLLFTGTEVKINSTNYRAYGFSVRCVIE
ncbi:MAG: fibrobacter succinogenes major paralogous domain-containing protein [Prevotellaceae bacterium]|jgi:hypothetical protein|nr:fibrobacter succinogenes major paralogous domain-containing protein [Prevotellaceae bacterium]